MEEKLISIIVPVYNVEAYLDKCLESICAQTCRNIEILVVDDGSTDSSGTICDAWKERDSRIKVYHKENGGQSSARNYALDCCTGQYIGFVDSDDTIESDMYEMLLKNLLSSDAQISICKFKRVDDYGKDLNDGGEEDSAVQCFSHDEAMKLLVGDSVITSHTCNKLFLKSLWAHIRFPVGVVYEDIAILHEVFDQVSVVVLSNERKYLYLIRSDSTSYRTDTRRDLGLFQAFRGRYAYYNEHYKDARLVGQCLAKAAKEGIGSVYRMDFYRAEGYQTAIEKIRVFFKQNLSILLCSGYLTKNQKAKILCITKFFPIYHLVCELYRKVKKR